MSKTIADTGPETTHSAPPVSDVKPAGATPQPIHEPVPAAADTSSKIQRAPAAPEAGGTTTRARQMNNLQRTVGNSRAGKIMAANTLPAASTTSAEKPERRETADKGVKRLPMDHGNIAHPDSTSAGEPKKHDACCMPPLGAGVRVQTQLRVNAPGDIHEQEADRVAEKVTQGNHHEGPVAPVARLADKNAQTPVSRQATDVKGEQNVEKGLESRIQSPGSGRPLEPVLRREMESGLGT